jgi:hypothetical protein
MNAYNIGCETLPNNGGVDSFRPSPPCQVRAKKTDGKPAKSLTPTRPANHIQSPHEQNRSDHNRPKIFAYRIPDIRFREHTKDWLLLCKGEI